jgi:hypothetical protein
MKKIGGKKSHGTIPLTHFQSARFAHINLVTKFVVQLETKAICQILETNRNQ